MDIIKEGWEDARREVEKRQEQLEKAGLAVRDGLRELPNQWKRLAFRAIDGTFYFVVETMELSFTSLVGLIDVLGFEFEVEEKAEADNGDWAA